MKSAVITGGNGGLGRALAVALQAQGWHTILMDIDTTGIEASDAQTPITVDLTDPAQLAEAAARAVAARPSIDLVIYNAGITQIRAFPDTTDATHRRVFEINYFSAVGLARLMLKPLRESAGTHLAISSVAGFAPLYHRTAYAASKHALEGFFSSLRSEEAPFGVKTVIAAPSFVATNLDATGADADGLSRPGSASDGVSYMSPEAAARAILKGVARGRSYIPVGRVARLSWWINSLSPRVYQQLMQRSIRGK